MTDIMIALKQLGVNVWMMCYKRKNKYQHKILAQISTKVFVVQIPFDYNGIWGKKEFVSVKINEQILHKLINLAK